MKVFLYETRGLVAQDILTESLQQLYNCHNNVKSELQTKLIIIFASKHGAQINVRVKRGFFKLMRHFYLKTFNFTYNTFFNNILRLLLNFDVDMRTSCEHTHTHMQCSPPTW